MKCDVSQFDYTRTWILLNAGTGGKRSKVERRIMNSISKHVKTFEPDTKNIYGRVAEILLFEKFDNIASYKGIGATAIGRIMTMRYYLSSRNTYSWIYGYDKTTENEKEDERMISFGDMNCKPEQELGKEYVISINGFISDDIRVCVKDKRECIVNLTEEEYKGVEKLFTILGCSPFKSITGLGVEPLSNGKY